MVAIDDVACQGYTNEVQENRQEIKMETSRTNDMWQFIQSQNSHLRMTDLKVASLLGALTGITLAILIMIRWHRDGWSADLYLMSAMCIVGISAFFVYGSLVLARSKEDSPQSTERRRDPA
ncbi:hypothetical protein [Collimonas sp. OK242]|uniref:hypothetical protein n=1 Tax=Collimonas sp. OK242 TaxID=1798195 RepID=UPI00115FFCEF|nr:hypothetical protein [Collimonas sp. OK242]